MKKRNGSKLNTDNTRAEVTETFYNWGLFQGTTVHYLCTKEEASDIHSFLHQGNLTPFERPDGYVKRDNRVLIIEHFAIDGYDTYPNGGSLLSAKESKIKKAISNLFISNPEGSYSTLLGTTNSYEQFIQNCIDRFANHYTSIKEYKEHLIAEGVADDNTDFTVCFLMEEKSPIGTLVTDGESIMPVCLAHSKEFLDFFKKMPEVDYIFSNVLDLNTSKIIPYVFSNKSAELLLSEVIDYKSMQFLSSDPMFVHRGFVAECREYALGDLLSYVQPTPYIVSSTDYNDSYKTPVLTAGKTFILGYTNETDGIFSQLPVIIFDDFTTASKYVDFPFKVKSSAMKILIPDTTKVLPKFIFYRMQIISFDSSTHKRYWIQQYSKIKVQVSPIPMQERIVARIEEMLSQLDAGMETLKKTKAQLAVYRQAVLKEAFVGDYPKKQLKDFSKAISGYAFKSSKYSTDGDYIVVKIGNVKERHFDFSRDLTKTLETDESILEKYLLQRGDCLITLTGSRGKRDYGFVAMIGDQNNYLLNQRVAALRFDQSVALPEFFQYYLASPLYRDMFFSYETGNVGQGNVGIKALLDPYVILPDIVTQKRIVEDVEARLSVCDSIDQTIDMALQQSEAMRQSILKEAFEGKL